MPHPTTPNIYLFNLQFYIKSKINPNPLSPTPCALTSDETELCAFFVSPLLILPFLFLFYASFSYRERKGGKGRVMATKKKCTEFRFILTSPRIENYSFKWKCGKHLKWKESLVSIPYKNISKICGKMDFW